MPIEDTLLNSCRELNNSDIISDKNYETCVKLYDTRLDLNIENDIFGNRNTINDNYEKYLIDVKKFIDNKFFGSSGYNPQPDETQIWTPLSTNMEAVTKHLNDIGSNFHNKENKNYNELVRNYNIIANNNDDTNNLYNNLKTL